MGEFGVVESHFSLMAVYWLTGYYGKWIWAAELDVFGYGVSLRDGYLLFSITNLINGLALPLSVGWKAAVNSGDKERLFRFKRYVPTYILIVISFTFLTLFNDIASKYSLSLLLLIAGSMVL